MEVDTSSVYWHVCVMAFRVVVVLKLGEQASDELSEQISDLVKAAKGSVQTPKSIDFVDGIPVDMDVVYNIGDAINKIGFGLVIYSLAVSDK